MIEFFEQIDRAIVLAINGLHNPFLDEVMWWVSARITWIPLYLILLYLAYTKLSKKQLAWFIVLVISAIALTDLASVHLFKNIFLRYRPSHNLLLTDQLHYYEMKPSEWYRGGQYGFVSSHAANYFALMTSVLLVFKGTYPKLKWYLFGIGLLICFSRIYLGVHYLSDVIVGGLLGALIALIVYRLVYVKFGIKKE
jgi:undecaprenyl-diphosphatase